MPTRDEIHAIRNHIRSLKEQAPTQAWSATASTDGGTDVHWMLWVNQAADVIQFAVPAAGSYLYKQAEGLRATRIRSASAANKLRARVLDLLAAAERTAGLNVKDAASDDLRRAVDIAVKDEYFKSWPFWGVGATISVMLVVVFGGTLYSTVQIGGIQKSTEAAQETIQQRLKTFEDQTDKKTKDLDQIIKTAVLTSYPAIKDVVDNALAETKGYVADSKRKLDEAQTKVLNSMNDQLRDGLQAALAKTHEDLQREEKKISDELHGDAKKLSDEWKATDQKLGQQLASASGALDSAKDAAVRALNARGTEVDEQKRIALSAIETTKTEAINKLNGYRGEAEGRKDEVVNAIKKTNEEVARQVGDAQARIEAEIAKMPTDMKRVAATLASLDRALARYHVDIARVLDLVGDDDRGRLGRVVDVLGWSFWLSLGALVISILPWIILALVRLRQRFT
jgi:hypothetical protein